MQEDRSKFEEHGYWNLSFIASMTREVNSGTIIIYNFAHVLVH